MALSPEKAGVDQGNAGRGHVGLFIIALLSLFVVCIRFRLWISVNAAMDKFFQSSDRSTASGGGRTLHRIAHSGMQSTTTLQCARAGLFFTVFAPLALLPTHGFMNASSLETLLLASYALLLVAGICCSVLESEARRLKLLSSREPARDSIDGTLGASMPRQPVRAGTAVDIEDSTPFRREAQTDDFQPGDFDGRYRGPPPPRSLRIAYMLGWLAVPLLSRNLDWSAYCTLPLGVAGMLAVNKLRSCWCSDYYALGMLCAPAFSIALGYYLDLANSPVATGLSVVDWRAQHVSGHSADAYIFRDGYVVGQWVARRAGWTHNLGNGEAEEYLHSKFGIAPVVANRSCIFGLSDDMDVDEPEDKVEPKQEHFTDVSGTEMQILTAVKQLDKAAPERRRSNCEVSLIVLFSEEWGPGNIDTIRGLAGTGRGGEGNTRKDMSHYHGCLNGGVSGALCVYTDPMYRAPRGIPDEASKECRRLLEAHGLEPLSICDTQYYLIGDFTNSPRQRHVLSIAVLSGMLAFGLASIGVASYQLSAQLRRKGAMCDRAWRYMSNIDELLL